MTLPLREYQIEQSALSGDCIRVEAVFFAECPDGEVTSSLEDWVTFGWGDPTPWKRYVGRHNLIERLFGVTWEIKITKARRIVERAAQKRLVLAHEMEILTASCQPPT